MSIESTQTAGKSGPPAHTPSILPTEPPPLHAGDHLSRAEFERRYQVRSEVKKAELVEAVVYLPAAVRFEQHGRPPGDVITWRGVYRATTPGVLVGDNVTVRLDYENEVQPDALWSGNLAAMLAVLLEGLVSPEYSVFAARLDAGPGAQASGVA